MALGARQRRAAPAGIAYEAQVELELDDFTRWRPVPTWPTPSRSGKYT